MKTDSALRSVIGGKAQRVPLSHPTLRDIGLGSSFSCHLTLTFLFFCHYMYRQTEQNQCLSPFAWSQDITSPCSLMTGLSLCIWGSGSGASDESRSTSLAHSPLSVSDANSTPAWHYANRVQQIWNPYFMHFACGDVQLVCEKEGGGKKKQHGCKCFVG